MATSGLRRALAPFLGFLALSTEVQALLTVNETSSNIILENDRLYLSLDKSKGVITDLALDDQDLLGPVSGSTGIGPYLDCYCTPSGFYTPGSIAPDFQIFQGNDSEGVPYAGVVMGETYPATGQLLEFYYFLREGETGLHTFSRLAYYNETTPFLRNLQEFRTLFRPNTALWTHLSTNEKTYAPLPSKDAVSKQVVVQDATWSLLNTPNDPYVEQWADYFTKYTFQAQWRDHRVHGMFSDGSTSATNATFGAWTVMNTVDTYFNGPKNSDLTVDGIVYNYIASNHHGNGTPNITNGFDRTFGPFYYHFNSGKPGTTLQELRDDALQYADPTWNAQFYDDIAEYVPNYVPTSGRGTWQGVVTLPRSGSTNTTTWSRPIAILTTTGVDFQDNVVDTKAYQYWADLSIISNNANGTIASVEIPRVKAGTYRLTIYADGLFGQHVLDDIVVTAGSKTTTTTTFTEESAGHELWRIGTPDRSSGEYRHGVALDTTKPLQPEQYRVYWAKYDFPTEFPDGVAFRVGESDAAQDWNYVHWSSVGGKGNAIRTETLFAPTISNWSILFDAGAAELERSVAGGGKNEATFTVQLAGAKTAAGNTDVYNATEPYSNLPYVVTVNGHELEPWVIPYKHSSSCAVRSAISCYNIAHKFVFETGWLKEKDNEIVLRLPMDAMDYESAVLPQQVYVQYDALRLELQ
ncbi:Rhamnogalacturonan lyase [Lasiodiplodia theobromae]|uniref:Rhamnogalacturonan lyase n=1 Tax=Lasiodiplodia theobromae TaxID=45133 RepID=UPI0015C3293A|nr:Rhamnogalacturonan lyase [Lasiodiplodia theobromae]KAF4538873.1 Rhamnogalacturonan lyase [Lasiodiplodia theobromae]